MTTKVSSYKKSDGTKVRGHTRSQPLHQRLNTWAQRGADSKPVTAMSLAGIALSVIVAALYASLSIVWALLMAVSAVALACGALFEVKRRRRRHRRRRRRSKSTVVRVWRWNRKRRSRKRAARKRTTTPVNQDRQRDSQGRFVRTGTGP